METLPELPGMVAPEKERRAAGRTSAMPFAEWSNEFSVGVEEIDGDHRRLLELLNELHDAVKAGGGHEALGRVLDGLMHYVDYHFSHEETLFIRTKYPGYERHRQQHRAFTITVKEIQEDFQLGASDALPQQVLEFLKNWLVEHIMGSDRAFGVYFNAHRAALESQAGRAAEAAPQ
jgi:hemerythrin